MALRGDFIFKKWVVTGQEEYTVLVPEDVLESDPNYDKRGQEITLTKDVGEWQDDPEETYLDHILAINSCGIHSERNRPDNKRWSVAMILALYENEDHRNNATLVAKSINYQNFESIDFKDVQQATDVYEFCYNYLKENADWIRNVEDI